MININREFQAMANPKSVLDGKCPYCGSEEGFTERWVQNMCQYYSFDGKGNPAPNFLNEILIW